MKSKKKLILAASILAFTPTAFPHVALAGTNPPQPPVPACSSGTHIPKVTVDLGIILSLLNLL